MKKEPTYITPAFFHHLQQQKTKIAKRVLKLMDWDMYSVLEYEGTFWIEKSYSSAPSMYNYAFKYLERWAEKRGLKYLYK